MAPSTQKHPAILHDLPSDVDQLGFEPYANALVDVIRDAHTNTPLTLGLFGTWGSGKSSLMRQIQKQVAGDPKSDKPRNRTVWFNAWKYNHEETLWRALLLVLLDDLEQMLAEQPTEAAEKKAQSGRSPRDLLEDLREALYHDTTWSEEGKRSVKWSDLVTGSLGLATSVLLSGLWQPVIAGLLDKDTVTEAKKEVGKGKHASDLGKVIGAFQREEIIHYQAQLRSLEQFQATFSELVRLLLPANGASARRLVVFIDDLDRCVPEKAITVLEALKLFLDVEGCIFVLALDSEAIESAISRRFKGEVKAREYLDKIVQVQFRLPPIEAEQMRTYVRELAPGLPDPQCSEVFAVALGANPRQVKRAINVFLLLSRIVDHRQIQEAIKPVRLAKVVAIQHAHPDLYALLLKESPSYLIELNEYYRKVEQGKRKETKNVDPVPLSETLQRIVKPGLDQIFFVVDKEDGTFVGEDADSLRSYLSLTQQATPVEASSVQSRPADFEPQMVPVRAGRFLMGTDPDQIEALARRYAWAKEAKEKGWFNGESPQHSVELPDFAIGKYPVMNFEYAEFVRAAGHRAPWYWQGTAPPPELRDHPVVFVTWDDALAYVQWLAQVTGKPYRLPSEAEWEKAAGWDADKQHKRIWPWGDDWDADRTNCLPAGPGRTTARRQYTPAGDSPYGCADMAGNVREWCNDWFDEHTYTQRVAEFSNDVASNPQGPVKGRYKVLRGGSWYDGNPAMVRCAYRSRYHPDDWDDNDGFRVARSSLT